LPMLFAKRSITNRGSQSAVKTSCTRSLNPKPPDPTGGAFTGPAINPKGPHMHPLAMELIRQALRWLGVWLMTTGKVPAEIAALVDDAGTTEFVIGVVSYGLAEAGWLVAKMRGKQQVAK